MTTAREWHVGSAVALLVLAASVPARAETWIKAVPGGAYGDIMIDTDGVTKTPDGSIVYREYNSAYPGNIDEHRVHCGQKPKHGEITMETRQITESGENRPTILFGTEQVYVDSLLGASAMYVCRKYNKYK